MSPDAPRGFLNLDKPGGVTSRDVVNQVVRLVGRRVKVGHAGTLDPLATGVLVVALGAATRLVELVQEQPKVYRTVIRLGARSDTLDADGAIVVTPDPAVPPEAAIREALARQVGSIQQVPPGYSALKVGGRRAYDLARNGQLVELPARAVHIESIQLRRYDWPWVELEIGCGSGTYIRSIARDLGDTLGCGALVETLQRSRIGSFSLGEALDPAGLTAESVRVDLYPMSRAVSGIPSLRLDSAQVARLATGTALSTSSWDDELPPPGRIALVGPDGELAALAEHDPASGRILPRKVLLG